MSKLTDVLRKGFALCAIAVTPRCRDVTRLLSRSLDTTLPWYTRLRLRLHLAACEWCERYGRHLRLLRDFSRAFPERGCEHDGVVLPPASRERLKAVLRTQAQPDRENNV